MLSQSQTVVDTEPPCGNLALDMPNSGRLKSPPRFFEGELILGRVGLLATGVERFPYVFARHSVGNQFGR